MSCTRRLNLSLCDTLISGSVKLSSSIVTSCPTADDNLPTSSVEDVALQIKRRFRQNRGSRTRQSNGAVTFFIVPSHADTARRSGLDVDDCPFTRCFLASIWRRDSGSLASALSYGWRLTALSFLYDAGSGHCKLWSPNDWLRVDEHTYTFVYWSLPVNRDLYHHYLIIAHDTK